MNLKEKINEKTPTMAKRNDIGNAIRKSFFMTIAIIIQVVWMYYQVWYISEKLPWMDAVIKVLAVIFALGLNTSRVNSSFKMPWIILILTFPLFGIFFYLLIGLNGSSKKMRRRYEKIDEVLFEQLGKNEDENIIRELEESDPAAAGECKYLRNYAFYPPHRNTDVKYHADTEEALEDLLRDLASAEKFIFMEYHAIEAEEVFGRIRAVLKERAAAGVDVRIFYDYVGSMPFINNKFVQMMEEDGIKCRVFNPMIAIFNVFMNNRDHRKITVIDGRIGYTGGYNLADEYFHIKKPYGHWMDTGVRITGNAVCNMTATFLENWNAIRSDDTDDLHPEEYLQIPEYHAEQKGVILPYADSLLDWEHTGENVYINILGNAQKYAYFSTPYLVITDEMGKAFTLAAKRGVDVRIITPGIPDKKIIYSVTRSYYSGLVQKGVRIYEYTPGFNHAKMCVSDDKTAVCGTINLDYRSLYHHFENGVLMFDCEAVGEIKEHFDRLFGECEDVTEKYRNGRSRFMRLRQYILRLFSSLM